MFVFGKFRTILKTNMFVIGTHMVPTILENPEIQISSKNILEGPWIWGNLKFVLESPWNLFFFLNLSWNVLDFYDDCPGKSSEMSWDILENPAIWNKFLSGHHARKGLMLITPKRKKIMLLVLYVTIFVNLQGICCVCIKFLPMYILHDFLNQFENFNVNYHATVSLF